jgi:hypothetical protein
VRRQLSGYGRIDCSTKLIRGLTSETAAGFPSLRRSGYDPTPVTPHNAPFPTYKTARVHHAACCGYIHPSVKFAEEPIFPPLVQPVRTFASTAARHLLFPDADAPRFRRRTGTLTFTLWRLDWLAGAAGLEPLHRVIDLRTATARTAEAAYRGGLFILAAKHAGIRARRDR